MKQGGRKAGRQGPAAAGTRPGQLQAAVHTKTELGSLSDYKHFVALGSSRSSLLFSKIHKCQKNSRTVNRGFPTDRPQIFLSKHGGWG